MEQSLKNYKKFIKESILDPTQNELSNDLWENNKLKENVKKQILDIFEKFKNKLKIDLKITEFVLVGSLTGYNYSDDSDIDIHIEFDTKDKSRINRLRKIAPKEILLKNTNHPINFYFLTKGEQPETNYRGIYDILEDKWIKKDKKYKLEPYYFWQNAITQTISWARKITLDIDELKRDIKELEIYNFFLDNESTKEYKDKIKNNIKIKEQEIIADYDTLTMNINMLKSFRSEAYKEEKSDSLTIPKNIPNMDYSLNNIIFKMLDKFGYLKLIKDTKEQIKKEYPNLIKNE